MKRKKEENKTDITIKQQFPVQSEAVLPGLVY